MMMAAMIAAAASDMPMPRRTDVQLGLAGGGFAGGGFAGGGFSTTTTTTTSPVLFTGKDHGSRVTGHPSSGVMVASLMPSALLKVYIGILRELGCESWVYFSWTFTKFQ